jgi:hypothetical protein
MKYAKQIALTLLVLAWLSSLWRGTDQHDSNGILTTVQAAQESAFDRARSKSCTLGTMMGAHGYSYSGNVMGSAIAVAGPINFDQQGNISGAYNGTLGGKPLQGNLSGNITVSNNCTGTVRVDLPIAGVSANGTFVIVNDGKETFFTATDMGIAVTGTTKKL